MAGEELSKNLFQTLERVSQAEREMIEYNGVTFRLEAVGRTSKLAGAVRRHAIIGDPGLLVSSGQELLNELDSKWAIEDEKL